MHPKFIQFIQKQTGLAPDALHPEAQLADDLGFYGLDAIAFFEQFFETFPLQNPEAFDADLHINGSVDFSQSISNWIRNRSNKERINYRNPDVTLAHLNEVVERGEWFTPCS